MIKFTNVHENGRSLAADPLIYLYDEMLEYKIILVLEICFVLCDDDACV